MLTIVGVQRKTGVYEGQNYDNIMLHCLEDSPSTPAIAGNVCETLKIKSASVRDCFDGLITSESDWAGMIGVKVFPYYDRYGRVSKCDVIDDNGKGV